MPISFEPIKPLIGSVARVEKALLCDDEVIESIRRELEARGVLVFPQFNITDELQLAFTDKLGERAKLPKRMPGADASAEDVYKITLDKRINTQPDYVLGTFFWHIDGLLVDIPLPKATVLSARQLSASGGTTEFSNLYAAYEHLPQDERDQIEGLTAIHTVEAAVRPTFGSTPPERAEFYRTLAPPMEVPIVWTHRDGRKSLLIGTHADGIVGWPGPHGRAMLWRLNQWASQPDFVYSHKWQVGDLVIWDNEALMHRVVPYTDEARVMHRTSLGGTQRPSRLATAESLAAMSEAVG